MIATLCVLRVVSYLVPAGLWNRIRLTAGRLGLVSVSLGLGERASGLVVGRLGSVS